MLFEQINSFLFYQRATTASAWMSIYYIVYICREKKMCTFTQSSIGLLITHTTQLNSIKAAVLNLFYIICKQPTQFENVYVPLKPNNVFFCLSKYIRYFICIYGILFL